MVASSSTLLPQGATTYLTKEHRSLMKDYFSTLGDSAHPESSDPRTRAITRFQELLLVSFREFSVISDETIQSERRKLRSDIVTGIEAFSKRATLRNLRNAGRFTKDQLGLVYDALFKAICVIPALADEKLPVSLVNVDNIPDSQKQETRIGLQTFRIFLSEIVTWARDEKIITNGFQVCNNNNRNFICAVVDPVVGASGPTSCRP